MDLSIITIVYNDLSGFKRTAQSVFDQKKHFSSIEYVVIDGGSTDGTLDAIIDMSYGIDFWISEPDKGIYDAMNKAIRVSTGDSLLFLNAGDYFVGNVLEGLSSSPFFLPVKYVDIFGRFRKRPIVSEKFGIPNCHQGIVFNRKGILYDTRFKIGADYKFFLDHGYTSKIPLLSSGGYVFFDFVGVSANRIHERDREIYLIRKQEFGLFIALIYEIHPALKRLIRFILRIKK